MLLGSEFADNQYWLLLAVAVVGAGSYAGHFYFVTRGQRLLECGQCLLDRIHNLRGIGSGCRVGEDHHYAEGSLAYDLAGFHRVVGS